MKNRWGQFIEKMLKGLATGTHQVWIQQVQIDLEQLKQLKNKLT